MSAIVGASQAAVMTSDVRAALALVQPIREVNALMAALWSHVAKP